jgi:hypothetical protein
LENSNDAHGYESMTIMMMTRRRRRRRRRSSERINAMPN